MSDGHDGTEGLLADLGRATSRALNLSRAGAELAAFLDNLISADVLDPESAPELRDEAARLVNVWEAVRDGDHFDAFLREQGTDPELIERGAGE